MKKDGYCGKNILGREKREEVEFWYIYGIKIVLLFWNVKYKERWRVKDEFGEVSRG